MDRQINVLDRDRQKNR